MCVGGRLGLSCHAESRDEVISSLPGLSCLDNETLIAGYLKRQCIWHSENKLVNKARVLGDCC